MMRLSLGYPSAADELVVLTAQQQAHPLDTLDQVVSLEDLLQLQQEVRGCTWTAWSPSTSWRW